MGSEAVTRGTRLKGAVLIAGPTASGKSRLAMALAERIGGVLVNADSMQVYDGLRTITARPTPADEARAPHHLYGHVVPTVAYSTGVWLRDVTTFSTTDALGNGPPIFVGGTGLYFRALLGGLSAMPPVPLGVRERWRTALADEGPARLHEILAKQDAQAAERLSAADGQRIVRALEVLEATGRSILTWQSDSGLALVDAGTATRIVLQPDRGELVRRIDARFDAMVADGALEEASAFMARGLEPSLPAMKAIGLRELADAARGVLSVEAAIERAKIVTRQYAKRQSTWFRNQFDPGWHSFSRVDEKTIECVATLVRNNRSDR